MKIFLIGFMGAGKSTAGRKLAARLDYRFADTDTIIENQVGKSINEIFMDQGEKYFRDIETTVLINLSALEENLVVSTGGGAPCYHDNMKIMNDSGITVYLKLSPQVLYNRLIHSYRKDRPLIRDKSPQELLLYITEKLIEREQYYNQSRIIFSAEDNRFRELEKTILTVIHMS